MSILSGATDGSSSVPAPPVESDSTLDAWISVVSCENVNDVWVCQTSNSPNQNVTGEVEKEDESKPTDVLTAEERQILTDFFLPIAGALSDEADAWAVPSQYDPIQAGAFFEVDVDSNFLVSDNNDVDSGNQLKDYFDDANVDYYGYVEYQPVVRQLYPRLVRKWRQVPCDRYYQASNPVMLFINEDELEPLADGEMCGIISSALIIAFMLLFCCLIQKIKGKGKAKAKTYRNKFSKDKTQKLLATTETGEVGSYVPPSIKIAVTKNSEKEEGEPYIVFI